MTVTDQFIDFALDAAPPDGVIAAIRASLFDFITVGRAGLQSGDVKPLRNLQRPIGHSSVFGQEQRVHTRYAALLNGAIGHALDYDDTHFAHVGHLSVVILPAVLAVAEEDGIALDAMLCAAAIGYESAIQIGLYYGRDHYQAGFHQTASAGGFGAVLALSRLLGLDAETTRNALGLMASTAPGLRAQFGTMGKPLNAGFAAAGAVEAIELARMGITAAPDGITAYARAHAGQGDMSHLGDLGNHWRTPENSHKFHACCHGLHAALECLAQRPEGLMPDQITILTNPRWLDVCDIKLPKTGLEAKFSYAQVVAMQMEGISTGRIESFSDSSCHNPRLRHWRDRVEVIGDGCLSDTEAWVDLDGWRCHHDLAQPLDNAVRRAKIADKSAMLLGDEAAAIEMAVYGDDLSAILATIRKRGAD